MGRKPKGPRVLGPYRRRDGRYGIVLRSPSTPDQWFYYPTIRKAKRAQTELEVGLTAPEPVTMEEAVRLYQEHLKAIGDRQSTVGMAGHRLRPLVRIVGHDTLVEGLHLRHMERRLSELKSISAKKGTRGRIRHMCAWLVETGLLASDPSEGLKVEGKVNCGKPQLTRLEARRMDAHLWKVLETGRPRNADKALAVLLLLYSGLRVGELLRLQVRDLDLEASPPIVQVLRYTKTRSSVRDFEVPEILAGPLRRRVAGWPLTSWLWPSPRSKSGHFEKRWVLEAVKAACAAAEVRVVCSQGLRASHARLAREAGVTAHVIAAQLGHANTAVTIGNYIGEEAEEAVKGKRAFQVIHGGRP